MQAPLRESFLTEKLRLLLLGQAIFTDRPFKGVIKDYPLAQGVPDLLAFRTSTPNVDRLSRVLRGRDVPKELLFRLLSLALGRKPRREEDLAGLHLGTDLRLHRAIETLVKARVLERSRNGAYRLAAGFSVPSFDLWAFEVKLEKWRRCLFQALQCKAYATHVVVVFPICMATRLDEVLRYFKRAQIGLCLLDPKSLELTIVLEPARTVPLSRMHHIRACFDVAQAPSRPVDGDLRLGAGGERRVGGEGGKAARVLAVDAVLSAEGDGDHGEEEGGVGGGP